MTRAKIPLSMTGDNLYGFSCECTNRHPTYAVCQRTVYAYKEDRLRGFDDCRAAIDARTCPAIKMMLAEKKAGKALFFESYTALVEAREKRDQDRIESERLSRRRRTAIIATSRTAMNEEQIANATQAAASKTSIEKPKRVESETFEPTGNMFADVINEMMKDGAA